LSLSLKYNTSVFDVRAKTLGKSKGQWPFSWFKK
jgi:hypothetical protein